MGRGPVLDDCFGKSSLSGTAEGGGGSISTFPCPTLKATWSEGMSSRGALLRTTMEIVLGISRSCSSREYCPSSTAMELAVHRRISTQKRERKRNEKQDTGTYRALHRAEHWARTGRASTGSCPFLDSIGTVPGGRCSPGPGWGMAWDSSANLLWGVISGPVAMPPSLLWPWSSASWRDYFGPEGALFRTLRPVP